MVNKRDRSFDAAAQGGAGAQVEYVDQSITFDSPRKITSQSEQIELPYLAVAIVTLAN
jgi:hypothetical protein